MVVEAGEAVTVPPLKEPGIHVYDVAPLDVKVEVPPGQIAIGFAAAVIVGVAVTETVTVAVFKQVPLFPVTV